MIETREMVICSTRWPPPKNGPVLVWDIELVDIDTGARRLLEHYVNGAIALARAREIEADLPTCQWQKRQREVLPMTTDARLGRRPHNPSQPLTTRVKG